MKDSGKLLRRWEKLATGEGWEVRKPRGGHWQWRGPAGQLVTTPSTPGEGRSINNIRATFKRNGLVVN
jgi:predicted RNA binding protein YcfA (HicA-like mRNA interferase family)